MIAQDQLQRLVLKWTADSEGYRSEASRLELNDRSRHATSIAMLEASAEAIDRCILEIMTAGRPQWRSARGDFPLLGSFAQILKGPSNSILQLLKPSATTPAAAT